MSTRLLTNQEVFDKVWDHFITKKNPQSIDINSGRCYYRGPQGERCAAGLFIPDEKYHVELEHASACPEQFKSFLNGEISIDSIDKLTCRVALILVEIVEDIQFLRRLQLLHDYAPREFFTGNFRARLIDFAKNNKLTCPQE